MKRLNTFVVIGLALVVAVVTSSSAPAAITDRASHISTIGRFVHYEPASHKTTADPYWTVARMANARPRDVTLDAAPALAVVGDAASPPGGRLLIPGHPPAGTAPTQSGPTVITGATQGGYRYPFPYSRYEVPGVIDYAAYPYSAVGKVFGHDRLGDYQCSGAAVVSSNESVVFTAGHCVHMRGAGWFDSLIFVPGYRDGVAPSEWTAVDAWSTRAWISREDPRGDLAAVVVETDPTGATLTDSVGALGFASGQSRQQHWDAFGYPAVRPFSGERQIVCSASYAAAEPAFKRVPPMAIGCDQTAGSSGGPWILDFGGGNYLNGLNSYGYRALPEAMFGPYFGGGAAGVLRCAQRGCS
jgi:V8-like Glu-specific endopeptidase